MIKKPLFLLLLCLIGALLVSSTVMAQDQPARADLGEGWTRIATGGNTACLRGTPYAFFVRPAESEKLMIYFQGGGACWDGLTCLPGQGVSPSAEAVEDTEPDIANATGIFDLENPENPIQDYNIVYVPYCSGDVHSGSNIVSYDIPQIEATKDLPIKKIPGIHRGFINGSAVMDWVYANFEAPEEVFITGCSAGGYGATVFAPFVMDHYGDVQAVHLADAAAGIIPPDWMGLESWRTRRNLPAFIPELASIPAGAYNTALALTTTAQYFPQNTFAEYNTFLDQVQVGFYGIMIGKLVNEDNFAEVAQEWAPLMLSSLGAIGSSAPNFKSFTAGGTVHCILPREEFYHYEVEGVRFVDWVKGLLAGEPVETVSCNAASGECLEAPWKPEE